MVLSNRVDALEQQVAAQAAANVFVDDPMAIVPSTDPVPVNTAASSMVRKAYKGGHRRKQQRRRRQSKPATRNLGGCLAH
ncbi:hypothetical protein THAR02_11023 [Trichoderma harzianum]|uniref:Uncharacterized protein n=1 Tax=Trichoderma harzianum TaxID=5544 RepID=A0A0F9WWL3_TRIHA|nr:hypothetical protein THAR02_11023 [Trichoderma harzianum]